MDYINMLRSIMETSRWSQECLAGHIGVSFATVNSWLNGKSKPRENMLRKIKSLYLAQEVYYSGEPFYITLILDGANVAVGDFVVLAKAYDDADDDEAITATLLIDDEHGPQGSIAADSTDKSSPSEQVLDDAGPAPAIRVANSIEMVARGTCSAGRIYDRILPYARARVEFVLHGFAIARIVDWGSEG